MEPLTLRGWWPALRRIQLLLVINACLVALGVGVVVIAYIGAAETTLQTAGESARVKLMLGERILREPHMQLALAALQDRASGKPGVGMRTIPSTHTNVFPENVKFESFPEECFARFQGQGYAQLLLCFARSDKAADDWIYLGFDACLDGRRGLEDHRFWLELSSGERILRWRLKPQYDKRAGYFKATAFPADERWRYIKTGKKVLDDKRVFGVIWPPVASEGACAGGDRVPVRMRLCARDLFLKGPERGATPRNTSACSTLTTDELLERRTEFESFLSSMRARLRMTEERGTQTLGGTSHWDGARWDDQAREQPLTVASEMKRILIEPGEGLALGPVPDGEACPRPDGLLFSHDEPPVAIARDWRARVLRTIAEPLNLEAPRPRPQCVAVESSGLGQPLALQLARSEALTEATFERELTKQSSYTFALLSFVAVLAIAVNSLILVPLSRIARQIRGFGTSWAASHPPQVSHGDRPDEVGLVASSINSLIRSVARSSEEDRVFNRIISHELRTPVHNLAQALPGNPEVGKILMALGAIDRVGNAMRSELPLYEVIKVQTHIELLVAAKQEEFGPLQVNGTSQASVGINGALLELAMDNVLRNAVRYRSEGSPILIRLEDIQDGVVFYIENSGPPIPPDKLEKIFELGYSESRSASNVGVGLYISRHYLRMMGGSLSAVARDEGAAFRFELPLR